MKLWNENLGRKQVAYFFVSFLGTFFSSVWFSHVAWKHQHEDCSASCQLWTFQIKILSKAIKVIWIHVSSLSFSLKRWEGGTPFILKENIFPNNVS